MSDLTPRLSRNAPSRNQRSRSSATLPLGRESGTTSRHGDSLSLTLDAVAEALFFDAEVSAAQLRSAARRIAERQGLEGAYASMFAPTKRDWLGIRLFTGERVHSRAGIAHLLGEEACRLLSILSLDDASIAGALHRAVDGMAKQLLEAERRGLSTGIYCCGTCSAGYWRNLARGLFPRSEARLRLGLDGLQQLRLGDGRWRRFPFYYTSLALTEIDARLALPEMQYAAQRWRHILPRLERSSTPFARRRVAVGRRLLELCDKPAAR